MRERKGGTRQIAMPADKPTTNLRHKHVIDPPTPAAPPTQSLPPGREDEPMWGDAHGEDAHQIQVPTPDDPALDALLLDQPGTSQTAHQAADGEDGGDGKADERHVREVTGKLSSERWKPSGGR